MRREGEIQRVLHGVEDFILKTLRNGLIFSQDTIDETSKHRKEFQTYILDSLRLEKEKITLTLMGAFQSGKSTLFSYLCGGWELSKIGIGLRTTGCCVTATALSKGQRDYAEVTWFNKDEIKVAIDGYTAEKVDEIQLDDRAWCRRFEQELLEQSRIQGKSKKQRGSETEITGGIYPAILMLHFFNHYRERCEKNGKVKMYDIENVVAYSCYPDKWERSWRDVRTVADIDRLFKQEDAAFIFCKRIDYYIDSPILRTLGCTIQDCPGLFANKRDSDLARNAIRSSDIILCTIQGDKGLSGNEKKHIEECKACDAAHKVIFGANLRSSLWDWEHTIKPEVIAELEGMGFSQPEIIHYHAPLALRCTELYRLLSPHDKLPVASMKVIQKNIAEKGNDENTPEEYLRDEIDDWIRTLRKKERFKNYVEGENIKWRELDELHHVPILVDYVKNTVLSEKIRRILFDNGVAASQNVVNKIYECIRGFTEKLLHNKRLVDKQLAEQEKKITDFRSSREKLDREDGNRLTSELNKIWSMLSCLLNAELEKNETNIVSDIKKNYIHGTLNWCDKSVKRHAFEHYLRGKMRKMLVNIRDTRLAGVFPSILRDTWERLVNYAGKTCNLVDQVFTGLKIPPLCVRGYGEQSIEQIDIPTQVIDIIFGRHEKKTLRKIIDLSTLGLSSFIGEESRARVIWNEIKPYVSTILDHSLKKMLNGTDSPTRVVDNFATQLRNGCIATCNEHEKELDAACTSLRRISEIRNAELKDHISMKIQFEKLRCEFERIIS